MPERVRSALAELTLVRFREFIREPEALFWVFGFPLLLAAGLGIAFRNRPADSVRIGVVEPAPAAMVAALREAPGLTVMLLPDDSSAARALRVADVALLVDPVADGVVEYRYDPSRREAQAVRRIADEAVQRAAGRRDVVTVQDAHVAERGARYIDFLIPGLIGLNLMGSGVWSIAFGVVTARNRKLLKRLVATPMSRAEYLLSYMLSRLAFLVLEVGALLAFGALVFGVPMRGSYGTLAVVCLVSGLAFSALGLLVSSRARTIEAVSGLSNLVMLPMWILSGVFFSAANFPDAVQPFIQALPLTATVDALRGLMLRGTPITALGGELAIMLVWLVVPFVVALKVFRWR